VSALAEAEAADAEARAKLYRAERQKRIEYQAALRRSLAGDPTAWRELYEDWEPLLLWLAERNEPGVPPEDELDPLGISDQVNVGR